MECNRQTTDRQRGEQAPRHAERADHAEPAQRRIGGKAERAKAAHRRKPAEQHRLDDGREVPLPVAVLPPCV